MLRLAWKSVKHNPKRLILTVVAVVLATSFVSGTFVLTNTVQNSFNSMFAEIYGPNDIMVQPTQDQDNTAPGFAIVVPSFDEAWVDRVAAVPGVESVEPSVNGMAVLIGSDGKPGVMGPPTIVMNWTGADTENITVIDGRGPKTNTEIMLDLDAAKRAGYEIGDIVTIERYSESENFKFTLVGVARFGASNALNGASLAFFTYDEAQMLARQEGQVAGIGVVVAEGSDVDTVLADIQALLPSDIEAKLASDVIAENEAQVANVLDVVNTVILAFALVAVFVGALLITNTFMTIVTQRTRELGLLRAIAATPRQIMAMILLEAALVGLVGSILGIALGYGSAALIKALLSTFAGAGSNLGALTLPLPAVIWGLSTGIGTTVVAATLPALHASRISPMEALRDEATRHRKTLRVRTTIGLSLLAAGLLAFVMGFATDVLATAAWVGIGGAFLLVGTILVSAALVSPIATWLQPSFRRVFGINGVIALNNAKREPRRTANTAGALMIGVLLLSLMTTVASSFKYVISEMLTGTTAATFVVGGNFMSDPLAPISDIDLAAIRRVDGVEAVHFYGWDTAEVDGKMVNIVGIDAASAEAAYAYNTEPGFSQLHRGEIYVSPSVLAEGYAMGDTITITGVDGTMDFTITGTYLDESDPSYWISWEDARQLHHGLAAISAWVAISDTADIETVRTGIENAVADSPRLEVITTDEYSKSLNDAFNQFLAMFSAMLSMAIIIAIFGVANTLFLSVAERTREIGLLRAIGVGRKAVRKMITLESVFMSVIGAVFGLLLGVGVGAGLVMSFDQIKDYGVTIPWMSLIVYTFLAILAGIVAAILPARRASKLNILEAVTTE